MSENLQPPHDRRRRLALAFWRIANPLARPFAGLVPWWVLLETTGHRSGQPRQVPLARGPVEGRVVWLISVHGDHAVFARNILAEGRVRLKLRGRWRTGTASLLDMDEALVKRFNLYARSG